MTYHHLGTSPEEAPAPTPKVPADAIRVGLLLGRVSYPGMTFQAVVEDGRTYLRVGAKDSTCNVTGEPTSWWGRKWRLSPHMTDGEVVFTAFKALLTALEHEARELFTFEGAAVCDSHLDIHKLVALRKEPGALAERAPLPKAERIARHLEKNPPPATPLPHPDDLERPSPSLWGRIVASLRH